MPSYPLAVLVRLTDQEIEELSQGGDAREWTKDKGSWRAVLYTYFLRERVIPKKPQELGLEEQRKPTGLWRRPNPDS